MFLYKPLCIVTILASQALSSPALLPRDNHLPLPTHLVHQFPNPTWIENVAHRTITNTLLLTIAAKSPQLYHLDPASPSNAPLLYTFPYVTSVLGITESLSQLDVFYLTTCNITGSSPAIGSSSIWRVDLTAFDVRNAPLPAIRVTKIADVIQAGWINGLTTLNPTSILLADSGAGKIYVLDVTTGAYKVWLATAETLPGATFPLGVNGLKIRDGYLYFTNSGLSTFNRVAIDNDGNASGAVEVLLSVFGDDFTFDTRGRVWLAQNRLNTVSVVQEHDGVWSSVVVDGAVGSLQIAGPTACVFGGKLLHSREVGKRQGRGGGGGGGNNDDSETLYVVTMGGLLAPINGTIVIGGSVVVINTHDFS